MKSDNPVLIFGAGIMGRLAKEILLSNNRTVYGFLDDDTRLHGKQIDNILILGNTDDHGFLKLLGKKCEALVAIDDLLMRKRLVHTLQKEYKTQPMNGIHRLSLLGGDIQLGHGNLVDMGAILASGVGIGNHNIIQAGVVIGVQAILGDFVHAGPGSIINSGVEIGDDVFIGSGVTIVSGIKIGKGARIGAGSVVIAPVDENKTVFGNPASVIKT